MKGFIRWSVLKGASLPTIYPKHLGLLSILLGALSGCLPAAKETTGGYLTRLPPPGLRFAPSVKLAMATLPPLPITHDPQPTLTAGRTEPISEPWQFGKTNEIGRTTQTGPTPAPDLSGISTNQQIRTPAVAIESNFVTPQLLIRFFPTIPGNPMSTEMLMGEPVSFHVPTLYPPSSATYEVK